MQTFRSQPSGSAQSDNNSDLARKESKYVPYIPEESSLSKKSGDSVAPETFLEKTPEKVEKVVSKSEVSQKSTPEPAQTSIYYAEPQQYMYYPPMQKIGAAGMDPESFRKMIIGLFAVGLILFIVLIIAFSGRTARHQPVPDIVIYQPQLNEKVDIPFSITGQARGYWFYDKAFPIILYDNTDTAIAYGTAYTTADIQNREDETFVPFSAVLNEYVLLPAKKKGYVSFQRSTGNLAEGRSGTITLPIRFGEGTGIPIITPITPSPINENDNDSQSDPINDATIPATLECGDGIDNDGDDTIDMQDADCHSDANASNSITYDRKYRENRRTLTFPDSRDLDILVNGFSGTHSGFVTLYYPNQIEEPINPSCSKTFPVRRRLDEGNLGAVVEKTIQSLVDGPTEEEYYGGFITGIKKGLTIQKLERNGTTLSIYFANNNLVGNVSWCSITDIKNQISQTMQQFADIDTVRIYANGRLQ